MRNNQLGGILLGLFFLSTLATAGLTLKYNSNIRQLQQLQPILNSVNTGRNLMQALLTDTVEYSKTHPDINRVLQPYITSKPQTAPPPATSTVPAKPSK